MREEMISLGRLALLWFNLESFVCECSLERQNVYDLYARMTTPPKRSPGGSALKRFTSRLRSSRRRKDVDISLQDDRSSSVAGAESGDSFPSPSGRPLVHGDADVDNHFDLDDEEPGVQALQRPDVENTSAGVAGDVELQAFADLLKDVLSVHGTVSMVQASLFSTERLTRTLKEQSGTSLEARTWGRQAAGRGGGKGNNHNSNDVESPLGRRRTTEKQRHLDAIRGSILVGTLASFEDATALLTDGAGIDAQSASGVALGTALAQAPRRECIDKTDEMELDELRTMLIDALLDKLAGNKLTLEDDVRRAARLFGRLAGPRVELECLLEYHAGMIRGHLRELTLQPGFSREPSEELAGKLGRTVKELLLAARELLGTTDDGVAGAWNSQAAFDVWALELTKETQELLERLVVLPLALPKGSGAVDACRARFGAEVSPFHEALQ